MTRVAVIDYGMGNTGSLLNMLRRIGVSAVLTHETAQLQSCSHLILPGVGSFDTAMKNLRDRGLDSSLHEAAVQCGKPFLGICLGMQLLGNSSEEGRLSGLGWISASVKKFPVSSTPALPVPHMSWNSAEASPDAELFAKTDEERFYFVHSYYMTCEHESDIAATTEYGITFTSAVNRNNIFGVQFHPEKSHRFGKELLSRFLNVK
jgi:glutamine amidotransferase